jgi:inorganic pyrophosphatase
MDHPAHVGCLLDVRLVAVIEADQTQQDGETETNSRLIAVSIHSYSHENITSIKQMNESILDQLEGFFISYNKLRGKKFKVTGRGGPARALKILKAGMKAFDQKNA